MTTPDVTPDAPLTPAPPPAPTVVTPVAPVVVARRGGNGGRWVNVLLGAALVVAVGGVAFAAGRSTAPASAATFPDNGFVIDGGPTGSFDPGTVPGGPGGPAMFGGGGPTIQGTVTAIDADSMTIKLASGQEVEVALDAETTYHEATTADASAVAVGDDVSVQASGGRVTIGGNGGQGDPPDAAGGLSATDVTVRR